MAGVSTIRRDGAGLATKATLACVPSCLHDHQQGRPLRCALPHGRGVYPHQTHSHWLGFSSLTSHRRSAWTSLGAGRLHSPARAVNGCAGAFHSANLTGANRLCVRNTLPNKQIPNALACRLHHLSRLSSAAAFAGFNTSEASNGRVPNSCGAFQKSEGELPNVGS